MALLALRDRTANTRLLVLSELLRSPGSSLSAVSRRIGITVQAVSNHARALARTGWLRQDGPHYRVTAAGVDALQAGADRLADALEQLRAPLTRVAVASAVAGGRVRAGERVGLVMEGGEQVAYPGREAASRGVARNDARAGEEVVVAELEGILALTPGQVTVLVVPGPGEGGTAAVDPDATARAVAEVAPDRVAAVGTGARLLAARLGRLDDPFAGAAAAFAAAEHGLLALLVTSRDLLPATLESLEARNARTLERVQVDVRDAPLARRGGT